MTPVGRYLREKREAKGMSVEEISRATRVPVASVERIENDQFDELPGEVFVRGFLKSYARAVGVPQEEVLARYTASRRVAWVTPLPLSSPSKPARGQRFGVAIAFVLLLILFTLALSIVLKPRGDDMPQELSCAPGTDQEVSCTPGTDQELSCAPGADQELSRAPYVQQGLAAAAPA